MNNTRTVGSPKIDVEIYCVFYLHNEVALGDSSFGRIFTIKNRKQTSV